MRRNLLIAATVIVVLHLVQILLIGRTPLGSFVANAMQISASLLAAVSCFSASRRGAGFTRLFWRVVSCSFVSWALGNVAWLYYESFLQSEPPLGSLAYVLTDARSLLLIMALLLEQKEDSDSVEVAPFLDSVQLAIIYALIYVAWYYVPSLRESRVDYIWRSAEIEMGGHVAVIALGLVQAVRARTRQIRRLYLTLVSYLSVLAFGAGVEAYQQLKIGQQLPTGRWLDLFWTGPFLAIALWADRWQPEPGFFPATVKEKSITGILLENAVFALAPIIVLLQAAELGPGWRRLSFSLLGISILCFAVRLSLSEFLEFRSAQSAHKANLERAEAESKFRTAFEANPESITITTLEDGTYLEVNDAFVAVMGYEHSELIGRSAINVGIWVDEQDRHFIVERLRRGERISDHEVRFRSKSGQEREMVISAHPVQLQGQRCILSILRDVTEQRLLEQRVNQARKMEAVGRLAGGVAHDFNNLLMITSANAELLERSKSSPEKVSRYAHHILSAADRGAALTRQMLAFSRQQILSPTVLNVNTVIKDLWNMLPQLLGEDVETVLHLDAFLGAVSADRGQLEQVIMNLALNARDAMPQGGKLVVETRNIELDASMASSDEADVPCASSVLLAVSDTGIGMSPEVQSKIFDPFFTTKELGKGTGLGLATVYGIVKQSGGSISVYSELGSGSTFKVYLPRVEAKEQTAEPMQREEDAPGGSGTILLVEDEAALRRVASEYLSGKGYCVLEAANGAEALDVCQSHTGPIDLLITDMVMPGSNGITVAKEVARTRPNIRTIFMSGYTDRALRPAFHDPDVVFLSKPFHLDDLARKIGAILSNSSSQ